MACNAGVQLTAMARGVAAATGPGLSLFHVQVPQPLVLQTYNSRATTPNATTDPVRVNQSKNIDDSLLVMFPVFEFSY